MKSHQRSTIGNGTIEEYMLRHYKKPKDFSSFLYVSQLLQAYGITTGIEAHRKNRKRCMGSLYWQINDCWPVASWSSIDYYGKWKSLHYGVKKSFKKTILSFDKKKDSIVVHVATDDLRDKKAFMNIIICDFEGNEIKKWSKDVTIMTNASNVYYTIPKADLAVIKSKYNQVFISAKLNTEEVVLDEKITFLLPFKDLELPKPKIDYKVSENETNYIVTITNDNLATGVYANGSFDENFSGNYFNMLPKSKKTIIIKKGDIKTLKAFDKALKIISLTDSYHQNIP